MSYKRFKAYDDFSFLMSAGEPRDEVPVRRRSAGDALPMWARVVIGVAAARSIVALILYLSAPLPIVQRAVPAPAVLPPWWMYAALSSTFLALGLGLVVANRRDPRAAWLGGTLTLAGTPFVTPLLQASLSVPWLIAVRPEAFTGAMLWHFVTRFPEEFKSQRVNAIVRFVANAAALVGLWCAVASFALVWEPAGNAPWLTSFAAGPGRSGLYWMTILGLSLPTLAVLLWRAAVTQGEARHRIRIFVLGLFVGFAPFTLEVLIEEIFSSYKAWAYGLAVAPWIGSLIFAAVAIVPFITTYSVLYDRVVDVRVVLRAAAQYALARYTVLGITLVPFAALAIFLNEHRADPIVSLVTGTRPMLLGSVITVGLVSFRLRSRWLDILDRRYFRESYDAHDILARVVEMPGTSARDLSDGLRREIARALHAEADVFLADESRTALRHTDGRLPSIAFGSKLIDLLLADSRPMDIDFTQPHSLLSRLPEKELSWLRSGDFSLIISLRRSTGILEGLLTLGPKRSGLPFSDDDRRLLSAIGSVASLTFDSLRLRTTPATPVDRPARECLECLKLSPFNAESCECGGELAIANVPHVLRGIFRFEQRIGAGGMGVVYKATDLTLGRSVAIKALPRVTPELVSRLRREARAMAAVTHPNLAVIHGVETWQGMPFLVQEYLAGGTLSQRMAATRMTLAEAVELGISLSGLLQHMHTSGVIHCDIKPSNIGFTQQGVVKLLDFGLARVMRDAHAVTRPTGVAAVSGDFTSVDVTGNTSVGWFGTPHFMSPEAANGEPPSPSFDLWALAIVLYEVIGGCRPYDGQDAWEILERIRTGAPRDIREGWPQAPASVVAFFDVALAPELAKRPSDAFALNAALRRLLDRIS